MAMIQTKRQMLKTGGNDLELARWSSHQPVRNGTHAVLRTRAQIAMFTCGVVRVVTVSLSLLQSTCVSTIEGLRTSGRSNPQKVHSSYIPMMEYSNNVF